MSTDLDLADEIAAVVLGDLDPDVEEPLRLVRRAAAAASTSRDLLDQSVASARAHGCSWAVIGTELGMSRQAAQQRYGRAGDEVAATGETRRLGPITAFDEMGELEIAGRQGWRTVGAGMFHHLVERTDTQWEHRRVPWTGSSRRLERHGWQVAFRAFPWVYLVRDTGLPAESGGDGRAP